LPPTEENRELSRSLAAVTSTAVHSTASIDKPVPVKAVAADLEETQDAPRFHGAVDEAKKSSRFGPSVNLYGVAYYQKPETRLFLYKDDTCGFALKQGDVISVFKHGRKGPEAALDILMPRAVAEGVTSQ